ncbi:U3 snoRNP protein [Chytriomyces hyalinus]|nr:U3 snoRNP protein [Chytriomyces hyalinus]
MPEERRLNELEKQVKSASTSIAAAIKGFEDMQLYASNGAEILEKFNFDAIANSLRFIANVGEMVPFISCACKVLSMMTAYIDSLEETKNDMTQLRKHCRLLDSAINLKIKVFFDGDSRWIVDDETCLTCYKVSLNEAVDALNSAIKRIDTYNKEGLLSKSMNRSKMDLKSEERKLDFALKSLTILDPFQLAFDISQIEHCFQSADSKRFWKSSRFRDYVTIDKFMKQVEHFCSLDLSTKSHMSIIQAVDVNMDGYVHVEEFSRVFNAETVRDSVLLLLESNKTFELGELRELCNPTDYAADAADLLRDYVSGTRDTLVNALDKEIQEVERHSVFILHATAGFGKSVIAAKLAFMSNNSRRTAAVGVDRFTAEAGTSKLTYLLYFFRHDDREIRTFEQFLKTLVYQMCCQLRSKEFQDKVEALLKQRHEEPKPKSKTDERVLNQIYEEEQMLKSEIYKGAILKRRAILKQRHEDTMRRSESDDGAGGNDEKKETLLDVVTDKLASMKNVAILIDACDECSIDSWQKLADFFKKLASKCKTDTLARMRVVLTIRNDETLKQSKFKDFIKLITNAALEDGSKDNRTYETEDRYLEGILARNEQRDDTLSKEERNRMAVQIYFESNIPHLSQRGCQILVEKSKGNMLWARLALNVIRDTRMDADVTYIAHNLLKPDMGSLYLEFFKSGVKMRTSDPEDLKRLLSIIASAVKPLLLKDVREAWRFTSSGISSKSDEQFAQVLAYPLCRLMVRTSSQGYVFLGHKSLRDMVDLSLLSQFVDTSAGHESLALFCIHTIMKGLGARTEDYAQGYASEHLLLHIVASGCKQSVIAALDSVPSAMPLLNCDPAVAEGLLFLALKGVFPLEDIALSVQNMLRAQNAEDSLSYKELDVSWDSAVSQAVLKFPLKSLRPLSHTRVPFMGDSSDWNCAKLCFVILGELKYNMARIASPYQFYEGVWDAEPGVAYAACQWCRHFSAASEATNLLSDLARSDLFADLARFCKENLLHWIETMLLLFWKSPDKFIAIKERIAAILNKLRRYTNVDPTALISTALLSDALNMLHSFQDPLEFNPLQVYHSALVWCPQESTLYDTYYDHYRENHNIPLLSILDGQKFIKTWKLRRALDRPAEATPRKWQMRPSIAISSKYIVVGYGARRDESFVQLWRTDVGDTFKRFQWKENVTAVAISRDNRWIVAGTQTGSLILQFLQENQYGVLQSSKHSDIRSVSIACDESGSPKLVAAAFGNNMVTLWDYANDFSAPKLLDEHKNENQKGAAWKHQAVQSLAFSKNGKLLAAGSENGTVTVWTSNGKFIQKIETIRTAVNHFVEEPIILAAESITVRSVDGASSMAVSIPFPISAVAISSDGTKIAAGGTSEGTINLWERRGQTFHMVTSKVWHSGRVNKLEFTDDAKFLFSAVKNTPLEVWNLQSMESVFQSVLLVGSDVTCRTFALSPDEKSVVVFTEDCDIKILSLPVLKAVCDDRADNSPATRMPPAAVNRVDSGFAVPSLKPSIPPFPNIVGEYPKPSKYATPQEWISYHHRVIHSRHYKPPMHQHEELESREKAIREAEITLLKSIRSKILGADPIISPSPHHLPLQKTISKEVQMSDWYLTNNGKYVVALWNGFLDWDLADEAHFSSKKLSGDLLRKRREIAASEDGRFLVHQCYRHKRSASEENLLMVFSVESNSDVACVKVAHARWVEMSGDGSLVAILSDDGMVYLWVWADGDKPVYLATFSSGRYLAVADSLLVCADSGRIHVCSFDMKTGSLEGAIIQLESRLLRYGDSFSIRITGSRQMSITYKDYIGYKPHRILTEHWEKNMGSWTLSSTPALGVEYGCVLSGDAAICWISPDVVGSAVVQNDNTIVFCPFDDDVATLSWTI